MTKEDRKAVYKEFDKWVNNQIPKKKSMVQTLRKIELEIDDLSAEYLPDSDHPEDPGVEGYVKVDDVIAIIHKHIKETSNA